MVSRPARSMSARSSFNSRVRPRNCPLAARARTACTPPVVHRLIRHGPRSRPTARASPPGLRFGRFQSLVHALRRSGRSARRGVPRSDQADRYATGRGPSGTAAAAEEADAQASNGRAGQGASAGRSASSPSPCRAASSDEDARRPGSCCAARRRAPRGRVQPSGTRASSMSASSSSTSNRSPSASDRSRARKIRTASSQPPGVV